MPRVLVADDDPIQLDLRKKILELVGYEVAAVESAEAVLAELDAAVPVAIVMDLRLPDGHGEPEAEVGLNLIRELHRRNTGARVIVLSGWPAELYDHPEEKLVAQILMKPVSMKVLIDAIRGLFLLVCFLLAGVQASTARTFPFEVSKAAEVIADLEMASPGADWSTEGREAALATVALDGRVAQHVMLYAGEQRHTYRIFLGRLEPGSHSLEIERHGPYSAPKAGLEAMAARFGEVARGDPYWTALAHAPILYARADTVGQFTDVPLIAYCERLTEDGRPLLQYTTIFSNEDGGTSTRALMARWGRTTDIEYIYRAWLNGKGEVERATIQANGHKEIEFDGQREGTHPILIPSTRNNMVSAKGISPIRYQLPPVEVDLAEHSRESLMDRHPWAYRVMGLELIHERKLRPFGIVEGEKISDPRNYLFVDFQAGNQQSAMTAVVRLKDETSWRSSSLGRADYAISRSGWVRTTVELPPGTRAEQIAEIGFECIVAPVRPDPVAGVCTLGGVAKVFLLKPDYTPGESIWRLTAPMEIPSGRIATFARTTAP